MIPALFDGAGSIVYMTDECIVKDEMEMGDRRPLMDERERAGAGQGSESESSEFGEGILMEDIREIIAADLLDV